MPKEVTQADLDAAAAAVAFAAQVRRYHRRRTKRGAAQREADIESAKERLKVAMGPIRSAIAAEMFGAQTSEAAKRRKAARMASQAIQAERRKLWKMSRRKEDYAV